MSQKRINGRKLGTAIILFLILFSLIVMPSSKPITSPSMGLFLLGVIIVIGYWFVDVMGEVFK